MKKRKPNKNDKEYVFKVSLGSENPYYSRAKEKVWRSIAALGGQSLYNFAESIVDAFGFDFDHCFGFFDNLKDWTKSKERYELFADLEDEGIEPVDSGSVKNTKKQA